MGLKGGIRSRLLYNLHASKATNRRITSHIFSRAARFRIFRRTGCFRYSRGCRSDFSSQADASKAAAHFIGVRAGTMGPAFRFSSHHPLHQRSNTMNVQRRILSCSISALVIMVVGPAFADCSALPDFSQLRSALVSAITPAARANGGLGVAMWGTLVANDGTVCAVAFSGSQGTSQWLGSRVISAQKANTANDFSVGRNATPSGSLFPSGLALSTANLFTAVQPGGSLYGLQHSNPVDTAVAYGNRPPSAGLSQASFNPDPTGGISCGTPNDPMVARRIGGVNVFGGGLALYRNGIKVGGVGVSGDTSCTDHMVAWRVRNALGLDHLQGVKGVADAAHPDNIIFDIKPNADGTGGTGQAPNGQGGVGQSASGFGPPKCLNNPTDAAVAGLPPVK